MQTRRIPPDELYHHGVKGQRWGIRRYQNEDGTLTEAGKARYGNARKLTKEFDRQRNQFRKEIGGYNLYNKASANMDFEKINEKHKNDKPYDNVFSGKEGQAYIKEVNKEWKKHIRKLSMTSLVNTSF